MLCDGTIGLVVDLCRKWLKMGVDSTGWNCLG